VILTSVLAPGLNFGVIPRSYRARLQSSASFNDKYLSELIKNMERVYNKAYIVEEGGAGGGGRGGGREGRTDGI